MPTSTYISKSLKSVYVRAKPWSKTDEGVRNLKDKHLGSLAQPLESNSDLWEGAGETEGGEPSIGVTTAPTSVLVVVMVVVVVASAGRGRAERIPARAATCLPAANPVRSATLPQYSGDR